MLYSNWRSRSHFTWGPIWSQAGGCQWKNGFQTHSSSTYSLRVLQAQQSDRQTQSCQASRVSNWKKVVTECGFFRLFCTYLGITVTDSWKLYKDRLGGKHVNKHTSILSFANVLCKSFLLNDYKQKSNESAPKPTLRCLETPHSKKYIEKT